ncbi:MAG: YIP1 family protein [Acidobacteria bacterium]|nr:YIP1 family protein [Acidobacteriota bacterium]MCG3191233.1 hypothetical protein [Thermoanaerobaculia bacterium]MCK6685323.1 YIP1 family protein [Thermoanaerobaculia bacterium]
MDEDQSGQAPDPAASPAAPSPWGVIVRVFYEPSAAFAELMKRPRWGLPVVLLAIVVLASVFAVTPKVDVEGSVRDALEKRMAKTGQPVSEAMIAQQVKISESFSKVIPPVMAAASVAFFLATVLILWGAAKAFGAEVSYHQTAAVWAHANLPNLLGALISLPVFLTLADGALKQQDIPFFFKSNVGAFLSPETGAGLRALAGSFDVFALWALVLLVLGFRQFPGLSRASATGVPIGLWVVYVLVKTGWNAVFG